MTVEPATKCARCGHTKSMHVMFGAGCTDSDRYQGCRCVSFRPPTTDEGTTDDSPR